MSSEEEDLRPISEVYEACLLSFRKLCTALENDSSSPNLQSVQINDDLGRFRVWAANIGAHRHGKSSLDYRLQEASYLKVKTTEFLRELNNALRRGTSVIHSGEHGEELISSCDPDLDAFSESSGSSLGSSFIEEMASESRSPLDSTLFKIKTIITCLYRLSITIRNPALRDRSQKYARIDLSHYEQWDIRRVADKFINAEDFLTTRLGKANTKRRQYLYYEKIHHENIAEMNDDGLSSFAKSQTTATAFIPTPNTTFDEGTMAEEAMSQTTLATTMTTSVGSEEILKVPDPPNLILDEPFECPYCFKIVEVQSTIAWRQHVFLDLQPYVCTFPTCGDAVKLYGSSREWYEHEVSKHRRQWFCKTHGGFTNKEEFTTHLNNHHPDQALALELTLERCERPRVTNTPDKCPLCGKEYSGKKLRSHLAKHMQQIALFVLPKTDAENDEETSKSAVIDRFVEYQLAKSNHRKLIAEARDLELRLSVQRSLERSLESNHRRWIEMARDAENDVKTAKSAVNDTFVRYKLAEDNHRKVIGDHLTRVDYSEKIYPPPTVYPSTSTSRNRNYPTDDHPHSSTTGQDIAPVILESHPLPLKQDATPLPISTSKTSNENSQKCTTCGTLLETTTDFHSHAYRFWHGMFCPFEGCYGLSRYTLLEELVCHMRMKHGWKIDE